MNKKDQINYTTIVRKRVNQRGIKMGFFLSQVGISASHWHFIRKGDRPLTDENKNKIELFLEKTRI